MNVATLAATLAAILLLGVQGLAAVELLTGVRRFGVGAAAAAALPLGLVAHAALALPLARQGLAPGLASATVETAGLALAAFAVLRRRGPAPPPAPPPRWRPLEIAAAGAIAAVVLLAAATAALEPPVEWDIFAIWGFKARVLAAGGVWLPRLADPTLAYAHPDYPLAWPLALALEPALAGAAPRGGAGLLGVALLAAAAGCAAAAVRRWGRRAALAAAALVATLPLASAQAVRALADLPLAALFVLAAGSLAKGSAERDHGRLALGAVATAGLVLVKQEGMALALAVSAVALVRTPREVRARLVACFAAAAALVDLPWLALRAALPAGADNSFADMTLSRVAAGAGRLGAVVAALPAYLGSVADWGALWLAVALALGILALDRARDRRTATLAWMLAAPLPLYLAALAADAWPIERLLEVALSRLALHFAPLAAALAVAVAARRGVFGADPTAPAASNGSGEEHRRVRRGERFVDLDQTAGAGA
jgi:hypothetical protein